MKTRQKVVLSLLAKAPVLPTRTQFIKWLFLLRQESVLKDDPTFYDFLPYRYGPFSFVAYRELDELARDGFLWDGQLTIPAEMAETVQQIVDALPRRAKDAIAHILASYGALSNDDLIEVVYRRYPWYARRSELRPASSTPPAPLAIYTIGYEGKSVDAFLNNLLQAGIRRVIDVRHNPLSYKYGFSKTSLLKLADGVGIQYTHIPELGIESNQRKDLHSDGDYQRLLQAYEIEYLPRQSAALEQAGKLLREAPSALLCFEADVQHCHRGCLALYLARLTDMQIIHL